MEKQPLREELLGYVRRLSDSGWVVGTSGNMSVRDPQDDSFLITPSGVDYQAMRPEDLFLFYPDGRMVPGLGKPTSSLAFHKALMQARSDCMAIVHTHAIHGTAASLITNEVPMVTLPCALYLNGPICVSAYAQNGNAQEASNIVDAFGRKRNAVLMQNHGVATMGASLEEAWRNMAYAEECCRIWLLAASTGMPITAIEADE